jgi:SsrA-binding protein
MKIINKKARFNYEILDRLETGIVLTGAEVKSVKLGHVSLSEAYVRIIGGQLFLLNAHISPYKFASQTDYEPQHSRKLLASKKQILNLTQKIETKNLTLVPTAMYTKGSLIKLEIALARGKKEFEKREIKKKRDTQRRIQKTLKNFR